jgi:hypothetical protein
VFNGLKKCEMMFITSDSLRFSATLFMALGTGRVASDTAWNVILAAWNAPHGRGPTRVGRRLARQPNSRRAKPFDVKKIYWSWVTIAANSAAADAGVTALSDQKFIKRSKILP